MLGEFSKGDTVRALLLGGKKGFVLGGLSNTIGEAINVQLYAPISSSVKGKKRQMKLLHKCIMASNNIHCLQSCKLLLTEKVLSVNDGYYQIGPASYMYYK